MIAVPVPRRRLACIGSLLLALGPSPACSRGGTAPADDGSPGASAQADRPEGDGAEGDGAASADVAPPAPALPAAEAILDRAAQAMGGKDAVARVHSFHYRGTIEIVGQNIHGDLEIWWKDGDFFMEQAIPGVGRLRAGKRGDEIWSEDPVHGRRTLSGVEAEQHAWASSLLLAAEWKRYFDRAETVAERQVDGRTLHDVELSAASGLRVTMSFDAESGLQVGQSFEQVTPMGKHPFDVRFEDYREVEGLQLAYRQVIDAKIHQIVQKITEVEINAEVDESRFAQPRDGADLVRQPAPQAG